MFKALFKKIGYAFPVQLLMHHVRKNQIMLLMWLLVYGFVIGDFAKTVGIPYLLLDPEYCNEVNFKSLFIMGLAIGMFSMAFHITGYILDGERFPFLASVRRPFLKYFLNNSPIPLVFLCIYVVQFIRFQTNSGLQESHEIVEEVAGFLLGYFLLLGATLLYFSFTHTDIFKMMTGRVDKSLRKNKIYRVNVMKRRDAFKKEAYRVDLYFESPWRIVETQDISHHDQHLVWQVFNQNHMKAVILEAFAVCLLFAFGAFRDNTIVQIPAAASALLLLALLMMFAGALAYWMRGWAITAFIGIILALNVLVSKNIFSPDYQAFGLNYQKPAEYSLERIKSLASDSVYRADIDSTTQILQEWKKKFAGQEQKPKMVMICTSGGGQRSATWTMRVLQVADSSTSGQLMKHAMLITGASGGMIGAAYYRELYLRSLTDSSIKCYQPKYLENIAKDVLNPVAFSLVVNDIFLRLQQYEDGNYSYYKDRGYAFEQQLHRNTDSVMFKRLRDYKTPERQALIPMLILSPTIINDGRKLYISPQAVSYMSKVKMHYSKNMVAERHKGVDFRRLLAEQDAENVHFASALRMSATFPYITPNLTMPTSPAIEIMDAGLTDNFGVSDALRFIYTFRSWINKNTGGVVLIIVRDSGKETQTAENKPRSIFSRMLNPIGTLYSNWATLQDNNNDVQIEFVQGVFKDKMEVINFQYIPHNNDDSLHLAQQVRDAASNKKHLREERASLSWHLTPLEKRSIRNTIDEPVNQESMRRLMKVLEPQQPKN